MVKMVVVATCLIMVGPDLSRARAAEGRRRKPTEATVRIVSPEALGGGAVITYDTGTNVGFYPDATTGNPNRVVGNRFNSQLGQPLLATGMVSALTVFPAASLPGTVSILGPPNSMGTAMALDIFLAKSLMAGAFNQITFPAVTVGPDFIGVFLGFFNESTPEGLLGMSDMATMGQGYHAVDGFYNAGSGYHTTLAPIANRNAMIRARGNPLPVELMDFRIK
jgi:hypothetical protein